MMARLGGAVAAVLAPSLAAAQTIAQTDGATAKAAVPDPRWVLTLASGILERDGDAARPFGIAGISRKLGRGYVRVAVTGFRSVVRQTDAALPSSFAIASIGAGGTFGRWFVDASGSAGRQLYGGVTTGLGTRSSQAGSGSGVYGGSLDGGRFIALARRLYLTPSLSVQYNADKVLRSALEPTGPVDSETEEQAWTGTGTIRVDRFFGPADRHVAGLSFSRVQTTNGAVALATSAAGEGAPVSAMPVRVGDGWFVAGASASFRAAPRLWIDSAANRTLDARSGDYTTISLGLRLGF